MKIKIAQVRSIPEKGNIPVNSEKLMNLLQSFDASRIDVVITPECYIDGYVMTENFVTPENIGEYALKPSESKYINAYCEWAAQTETWLILGCMRKEYGDVFNSALVIDRQGSIAGIYDKIHCQTHEKKHKAGDSLPVFDSDFGTFGVMICADRRWPETVRTLAVKGAVVIFNPTYGMHHEKNLHMMQVRSYESEVFIAFTHPEQSLITDPAGNIVCNENGKDDKVFISEICLDKVERVRAGFSAHLKDRRTDVYEGLQN